MIEIWISARAASALDLEERLAAEPGWGMRLIKTKQSGRHLFFLWQFTQKGARKLARTIDVIVPSLREARGAELEDGEIHNSLRALRNLRQALAAGLVGEPRGKR